MKATLIDNAGTKATRISIPFVVLPIMLEIACNELLDYDERPSRKAIEAKIKYMLKCTGTSFVDIYVGSNGIRPETKSICQSLFPDFY